MEKRIVVDDAVRKELMAMFKVSNVSVWKALKYHTKGGLSKAIRAAAIQRGGQRVGAAPLVGVDEIDVVTYFETAENQMIQLLADGRVKIVVSTIDNSASMEVDGREVATVDAISFAGLKKWHESAMLLIN